MCYCFLGNIHSEPKIRIHSVTDMSILMKIIAEDTRNQDCFGK